MAPSHCTIISSLAIFIFCVNVYIVYIQEKVNYFIVAIDTCQDEACATTFIRGINVEAIQLCKDGHNIKSAIDTGIGENSSASINRFIQLDLVCWQAGDGFNDLEVAVADSFEEGSLSGEALLRQHSVVDIVSQEGLDRLQMPCG